jgi:F0F1-type ATP synthase assembly protein I
MALKTAPKRLTMLVHILTALVIFLHGFDKLDKGESGSWIFFLIGVLVVLILIFHRRLAQQFRSVDSIFHMLEAIVLLIIAYEYYHHGAWGLQYGYALAAIGHIIGAIVKAKKSNSTIHS